MKRLCLYDDAQARTFQPFVLTRPVSELRAGAEIIRRRWERATGTQAAAFASAAHLADFEEGDAPQSVDGGTTIPAGTLVASSRFAVALDAQVDDTSPVFENQGEACAVRLRAPLEASALIAGDIQLADLAAEAGAAVQLAGRWLHEVWDLVGSVAEQLSEDIPRLGASLSGAAVENATILGRHKVYCETGARIEPFVVLDASDGPILIRRGASVASFSRIVGPCYIGEDTHVIGDAIRACSIGEVCKVHGEMAGTVMLGHSNKSHTGFVGSSYIGRWVNLGAGTTTSNLKNTYGRVQLQTVAGLRDTGLQFLGSLIGDHAKTGIGTMLTTGCSLGAGANLFGTQVSPKLVPPFAWGSGEPFERFDLERFLVVAERMMERRHVALSARARALIAAAWHASGGSA